MSTRGIDNAGAIVIVVNLHDGEISTRGHFRERDGRTFGRIRHSARVERVLIHTDHCLLVERSDSAEVEEAIHAAGQLK
jgi:hypothetical protein